MLATNHSIRKLPLDVCGGVSYHYEMFLKNDITDIISGNIIS